jgi:hypothetical protein
MILVTFRIFSETLIPSEITLHTRIQPDRTNEKGTASIRNRKFIHSSGKWSIRSKLDKANPNFEEHIESILDVLEPHKDYFYSLSKLHTVDLLCTVNDVVDIILTSNTIQRMASMGISLTLTV